MAIFFQLHLFRFVGHEGAQHPKKKKLFSWILFLKKVCRPRRRTTSFWSASAPSPKARSSCCLLSTKGRKPLNYRARTTCSWCCKGRIWSRSSAGTVMLPSGCWKITMSLNQYSKMSLKWTKQFFFFKMFSLISKVLKSILLDSVSLKRMKN